MKDEQIGPRRFKISLGRGRIASRRPRRTELIGRRPLRTAISAAHTYLGCIHYNAASGTAHGANCHSGGSLHHWRLHVPHLLCCTGACYAATSSSSAAYGADSSSSRTRSFPARWKGCARHGREQRTRLCNGCRPGSAGRTCRDQRDQPADARECACRAARGSPSGTLRRGSLRRL